MAVQQSKHWEQGRANEGGGCRSGVVGRQTEGEEHSRETSKGHSKTEKTRRTYVTEDKDDREIDDGPGNRPRVNSVWDQITAIALNQG